MPGQNSGNRHSDDGHPDDKHAGKPSGWLARIHNSLHAPHLLRRFSMGLLRLIVITLVMMVIGRITEKLVNKVELLELDRSQAEAMAAVHGINPLQIKDRFLCAITPSVADMNRKFQATHTEGQAFFLGHQSLAGDCAYTLSRSAQAQTSGAVLQGDALPPPVVGHWGDGITPIILPVIALLDTGWHLIVQPSLFASIFAIFAFVMGGILAGVAMVASRQDFPGYVGPIVWSLGTIVCACLVAWGLREIMEGGLFLFGKFTQFAGLCCGGGTVTYFGYSFTVKALEVKTHGVVEHMLPG